MNLYETDIPDPQREGGLTMRTASLAPVATDLQEKEEAIQSQPEAQRSHAAVDEHQITIGNLISALYGCVPYMSIYSTGLRFVDHRNGR